MERERFDGARNGMAGCLEPWLELNSVTTLDSPDAANLAPFPPLHLMRNTTGLERDEDFAAHGVHIVRQLADLSPIPLSAFTNVLDLGVGVGRLARMFKGFSGRYVGVDVDPDNIAWISSNFDHVEALAITPNEPLPFSDAEFDAVMIISVFTHMAEADQAFCMRELQRVTRPGACLFVTVHGERALQRAETEAEIFDLLQVPLASIRKARKSFDKGIGFSFTVQSGHLTTPSKTRGSAATLWTRLKSRSPRSERPACPYRYGITFVDGTYVHAVWSQYFDVAKVWRGAIHDFQDLILLRRRTDAS